MGSYSEIRFMNRSRRSLRIITSIVIILTPPSSYAWNYTGHRVIASIAYRQLDDQTKRKIAEVLKKHPANADLWANGPDEILNLLWNASVFPDDARSEPWRRYGRAPAHYVNTASLVIRGTGLSLPSEARTSSTPTLPTCARSRAHGPRSRIKPLT